LLIVWSTVEIHFFLKNVKSALHSKELRQKMSVVSEDQAEGLFVRGHTEKDREKSRFKSTLRKKYLVVLLS